MPMCYQDVNSEAFLFSPLQENYNENPRSYRFKKLRSNGKNIWYGTLCVRAELALDCLFFNHD